MSEDPSIVFKFDNSDPAMQNAYEKARETFRYFYRETVWESRRIVPGLDVACVKAPFADPEPRAEPDGNPDVEHMWISEVDFDGKLVSGTLLNTPNWLKSYTAGDRVDVPLARLSDWMYVCGGEVFGAYTVNLMRSRMDRRERKQHDDAWGLNFGDPDVIQLVPAPKPPNRSFWQKLFGGKPAPEPARTAIGEHPMSVNMAPVFRKQITEDPSILQSKFDRGWTHLHREALAGSAPTVQVMLELGADPNARAHDGATPLQLAQSLRWDAVVTLLKKAGAR